ncbi:hypothetical protein KR222_009498 [Zaprionus bogoriensis]|nr:hypothetical protein KR222_009498 [Zaprionus bogoriensis]
MTLYNKPPTVKTFTCLLLGDHKTGKTSFMKRHLTGEFVKEYVPSEKDEEYTLWFDTNHGRIEYHVWDTAEKNDDLTNPDCIIIMSDVASNKLFNQTQLPYSRFVSTPVILCSNKIDLEQQSTESWNLATSPNSNFQFVNISVKKSVNIDMPFLLLSRELLGQVDLQLICQPALMPPEHVDSNVDEMFAQIELNLLELPEDSDDDW